MNKYLNKRTEIDGIKFDSLKEGKRYSELKMLERAGMIKDLKVHPRYLILPAYEGLRKRYYEADFQYREGELIIVEDVKSQITAKNQLYRLKRQMFLVTYGESYEFRES